MCSTFLLIKLTMTNKQLDPYFYFPSSSSSSSSSSSLPINNNIPRINYQYHQSQNPRKKPTKLINTCTTSTSSGPSSFGLHKPKCKKPDPSAPKITRPCTECGKKFWSWKALFGHMRCHPERQWRGINPPPNHSGPPPPASSPMEEVMSEEERDVASCLLLLANRGNGGGGVEVVGDLEATRLFEYCSSCKKVFGSHQAFGGHTHAHRATHKNVKGCLAIMRGGDASGGGGGGGSGFGRNADEKANEAIIPWVTYSVLSSECGLGLDLNLPASAQDGPSSSYPPGFNLDLSLGR